MTPYADLKCETLPTYTTSQVYVKKHHWRINIKSILLYCDALEALIRVYNKNGEIQNPAVSCSAIVIWKFVLYRYSALIVYLGLIILRQLLLRCLMIKDKFSLAHYLHTYLLQLPTQGTPSRTSTTRWPCRWCSMSSELPHSGLVILRSQKLLSKYA